ncbi:MAG: hypothetical protein H3Z53_01515 [archaeon]|nr:hypothetical protein [archaeon]MCP8313038.1 hypothetical protein [archaeon]MCP8317432.1 hypothetical protein [archaeon]MCP8320016.1 hypothetical protein [archaeon]
MRANTIIGGIIIAILLASVIFAFASPIVLGPLIRFEEDRNKVFRTYSLTDAEVSGVDYVSLNFTVKTGGIDVNFTDESNLIYRFVFKQDQGVAEPYIENVTVDNKLLVKVMAESGDVKVTFGNNYTYDGTLKVGLGGIVAKLSKDSNVEFFDLVTMYAGGVSVEVYDDTSFDHLNIRVNAGGIMMRIEAENLERNSSISARVEVGGVMIGSIPKGTSFGSRLRAFADIGGISLNRGDLTVIKETVNEVEIMTDNYPIAPTKLDIEIFTGLGGSLINQPLLTFPSSFG